MTDKPNFIARHVISLREVASAMCDAPGVAEMLNKSASIIEQLVDGIAALRVQHERERTELSLQLSNLAAQMSAKLKLVEGLMTQAGAALGEDLVGEVAPPGNPAASWRNLPCSPADLNALIKLMPHGWAEIEWSEEFSTFVVLNSWGIIPAVLEDYEWQDLHPDPGPGMHHKRPEDCFEHWPEGRRCFAEYTAETEETDGGFRLLAINDDLVYSDPEGTPAPVTFEMCQDCDANLGSGHIAEDHCPICHKDGTLLLMREDGVRVP